MLDIEDRVDTDALMITRRLCISHHIAEGIILHNCLIHLNANGKLPKVVICYDQAKYQYSFI
jgi:predicted lipid carrier protein YhbT